MAPNTFPAFSFDADGLCLLARRVPLGLAHLLLLPFFHHQLVYPTFTVVGVQPPDSLQVPGLQLRERRRGETGRDYHVIVSDVTCHVVHCPNRQLDPTGSVKCVGSDVVLVDRLKSGSCLEDVQHINGVVIFQALMSVRNHALLHVGTQTSPVPEKQLRGSDVCCDGEFSVAERVLISWHIAGTGVRKLHQSQEQTYPW